MSTMPPPTTTEHPPDSLNGLLQAIVDTADLPQAQARSLPPAAYHDPAYYAWEVDHVLRSQWLCLGHVSEVPNAGDHIAVDLLDEPLVVVRGKDQQIRVLSRVCQHRAMDMMPPEYGYPERGNQRVFICPYHFWGYELDGQLKGAPEMHQAECFNRRQIKLYEHRSEIWEGFIFVNLSGDAPPLSDQLVEFKDNFVGKFEMDRAQIVWSQHWDCDFNWKILVENFMEPYHHMGAHRKTLEPILPASGCWAEAQNDAYCAVHLPLADHLLQQLDQDGQLPGFTPFRQLTVDDQREWWVFLVYPTFLLFVAPDRLYWYRLIPQGPDKSSLLTTMAVSPEAMEAEDYQAWFEQESQGAIDFHMEDMEMCTATHRGLKSKGATQGHLSHLEAPIWQIQQHLASRIRASGRLSM
jgi:phenylpropionate dioxygenase-like ring-hydroxylating dioxygenase large terminal subunit